MSVVRPGGMGTSTTVPVVITNARSSSCNRLAAPHNGQRIFDERAHASRDSGRRTKCYGEVNFAPKAPDTNGGSLFVSGPALAIPLRVPARERSTASTSSGIRARAWWATTFIAAPVPTAHIPGSTPAVDSNTAYTDGTVVSGQTYYYAATSVNSSGQESTLSTPPVHATVP